VREGGQVRGEGGLILFRSFRQEQVQHPPPGKRGKIMIIVIRVVLGWGGRGWPGKREGGLFSSFRKEKVQHPSPSKGGK
jgi:hypothetical protein